VAHTLSCGVHASIWCHGVYSLLDDMYLCNVSWKWKGDADIWQTCVMRRKWKVFISCRLEVRWQCSSVQNSNRTDKFQWRCPVWTKRWYQFFFLWNSDNGKAFITYQGVWTPQVKHHTELGMISDDFWLLKISARCVPKTSNIQVGRWFQAYYGNI
jgi:hypothetical protein